MSNRKIAIIAAIGTRDAAYKVFNIATAAASMGAEVSIFFTFEGLKLIHKQAYQALELPPAMAGLEGAMKANNLPEIPELVSMAQEMGVNFIACQMTMDLMSIEKEHLVDGIEVGGAASFLAAGFEADITLTF
ncbi:MAG: DsrE/DsrF/DrsH-like family protein [Bacillota bacterium]